MCGVGYWTVGRGLAEVKRDQALYAASEAARKSERKAARLAEYVYGSGTPRARKTPNPFPQKGSSSSSLAIYSRL